MTDILSNWAANAALTVMLPPGCYLGAFLADPTPLGSTSSEVAGGGYEREAINFAPASNRVRVSINAQAFTGMPACTVAYLAVFTAIGGGHLVFARKLPTPIRVLASGQLLVARGDVALSL